MNKIRKYTFFGDGEILLIIGMGENWWIVGYWWILTNYKPIHFELRLTFRQAEFTSVNNFIGYLSMPHSLNNLCLNITTKCIKHMSASYKIACENKGRINYTPPPPKHTQATKHLYSPQNFDSNLRLVVHPAITYPVQHITMV